MSSLTVASLIVLAMNFLGISAEREIILAHDYSADFHVAFAMITVVVIVLVLVVIGFSVFLWNMDPGRDSIIYRMTTQRIKKDQ